MNPELTAPDPCLYGSGKMYHPTGSADPLIIRVLQERLRLMPHFPVQYFFIFGDPSAELSPETAWPVSPAPAVPFDLGSSLHCLL